MKCVFKAIGFILLAGIVLIGCSKYSEDKPRENIYIRIKNTSLVDYLNVKIFSDPQNTQMKEFGLLKSGGFSEYMGFNTMRNPVSFEVKLTQSYSQNITYFEGEALAEGKYTLEIFTPNRGDIIISAKLVKDE